MRLLAEIRNEQRREVEDLARLARETVIPVCEGHPGIIGALLSGSVARGDARIGPMGLYIDVVLVAKDKGAVDLTALFGPDEEPDIPFHCVGLRDKVGVAIELVDMAELDATMRLSDSTIFARQEARILRDTAGRLAGWKAACFRLTEGDVKSRSLRHYSRFGYLIGEYRMEKWLHREAFVQVNQNLNEAVEEYCCFLHCANGGFVPRKDWLVYLTYELALKPAEHAELLPRMYESANTLESVQARHAVLLAAQEWMRKLCRDRGWLGG